MLSRVSTTQRSLHVFVAGVIALILVVCALEGYNLWRLRQVAIENQLGAAAQHAGTFEEHLTQTLSVVDIALTNLGEHDAMEAALPALLRNARYLRSISQLDAAGRVVASSEPRNVNQQFDRSELLPMASGPLALLRIGPLTAGRDLFDAQRIKNGAGVPPQSFIPVQRDVLRPDGSYATMVAVINPDYFLNYYGRDLDTGVADMELYRLDGGLLLSTAQEFSPGSKSNALVMEKLAKAESGRFQEDLPGVPSRLVGYRVSRHFPVVVVVQFDASKALAAWRREATTTLTVLLAVLVTTVAMLLVYFRRWQRFAEERQTWVHTLTKEIAERKQAEIEALRASNLLRGSIDALDEGFVIYDPQDRFVLCNDKYRQTYSELAHLMVPGTQFEDILRASAETGRVVAAIGRVDEWAAERLAIHLATNSAWIQKLSNGRTLRIYERRLPDGHIVGFRIDITESQRAQDEILRLNAGLEEQVVQLRVSTEKLRFAAEAADLYDWEWDVPRDTLTWGRDPVRLLGQPDQRTGKYPDFRDLVHPEDRERYLAVGRHSMKTGETYALEFRMCERDGAARWIATRGKVVYDSTGAPARMLGVSQDITERKRAQDEILRLNAGLEERVQQRTEQLALTSRYKSEFLSTMSHELRTPLNSLLILSQLLAENDAHNMSDTQIEYAKIINASGKDLLALINDILDLSKIESGTVTLDLQDESFVNTHEQLERTFRHVAKSRSMGFDVELAPNLPPSLYTDSQRLQQVLKNLLSNAFKFTEKGRVSVRIARVASGWSLDHDGLNRAQMVIGFFVADTGIGLSADKQKMIFEAFQQADTGTARRYGGTGLGLSISREIARLLGGELRLAMSSPGNGSTFVLYLPLRAPELLGSDTNFAAVRSTAPGGRAKGSANLGSDPKNSPNPQPPAALAVRVAIKPEEPLLIIEDDAGIGSSLAGKKVLLVDDDVRNLFSLTTLLERHKMAVLPAENGYDALNELDKNPDVHIVLMDIMMPEMDGFETMRQIRKMKQFESLPIIALTAKAMKGDREKCIAAGASDYLSKPVDTDQLVSLLRVWLYQ